jgi:X-X-X-Leu-X-X-Gly heptad repeat protein
MGRTSSRPDWPRPADGTIQLTDGQKLLTTKLGELSAGAAAARSGIAQISDGIKQISPQMKDLIDGLSAARDFLNEVSANVSGGPDALRAKLERCVVVALAAPKSRSGCGTASPRTRPWCARCWPT